MFLSLFMEFLFYFDCVQVLSEPGSGIHLLSRSLMSPRGSAGFITPSKFILPSKKDEIDLSSLPQFPSDITVASTRSPSPDLDSQLQGSWTHRHVITVDQFTRGQVLIILSLPIHMLSKSFLDPKNAREKGKIKNMQKFEYNPVSTLVIFCKSNWKYVNCLFYLAT